MDLRELRSFCAVAQYGSITKAAQTAHAAPACSDPSHPGAGAGKRASPCWTGASAPCSSPRAGVHLSELAKPLLRQIDSLPVETSSFARQGSLTVASTTEMARNMLVDSIVAYRQSYPDTRLQLLSGRLPEVLRMVRDREADLGFVPLTGRFGEFNVETLFTNERVLLAAKGHPVLDEPIESIPPDREVAAHRQRRDSGQPLVHRGEDSTRQAWDYRVVMRLDHFDAVKRYVSRGLGISVVPRIILEPDDEKSLGIVALGHILDIQSVGIVTVRDTPISRYAQQFVSMLRETIPDHISPLWP